MKRKVIVFYTCESFNEDKQTWEPYKGFMTGSGTDAEAEEAVKFYYADYPGVRNITCMVVPVDTVKQALSISL